MLAVYLFWLVIFTFVGMYRTWFALSRFDELSTLFKASFFGVFILFFSILYSDYTSGVQNIDPRFYPDVLDNFLLSRRTGRL